MLAALLHLADDYMLAGVCWGTFVTDAVLRSDIFVVGCHVHILATTCLLTLLMWLC